jgi:hypothetical protein
MEINNFSSYETYLLQNNHYFSFATKISRRELFFAKKNYVSPSMKYKDGKRNSSLANCVSTPLALQWRRAVGENYFSDTLCITRKKKASIIQLDVQYPCRRN